MCAIHYKVYGSLVAASSFFLSIKTLKYDIGALCIENSKGGSISGNVQKFGAIEKFGDVRLTRGLSCLCRSGSIEAACES